MKQTYNKITQGLIIGLTGATALLLVGCGQKDSVETKGNVSSLNTDNGSSINSNTNNQNNQSNNQNNQNNSNTCTPSTNTATANGATSTIPFTLLNHTLYGTGSKILTKSNSMLSSSSGDAIAVGDYTLPNTFSSKSVFFIQGGDLEATLQTTQVSSDFTGSTCGNYGWMHPISRGRVTVTLYNATTGSMIGNPSTLTLGACPNSIDFHDAIANNLSPIRVVLSQPSSDDGMPKQPVFPYNSFAQPNNSVLNPLYSPKNGCEYSMSGSIQVTTDAAGAN